jgi:uncharacterized membrane protein YobD (UPF0266 family)
MVDERTIFVLDGAGALLSVFLLGVCLPAYTHIIGMPPHVLYLMCAAPAAYLLYDIYAFFFANHRNPKWLQAIMLANLGYCLFTSALVILYFQDLSAWGRLYFTAELGVILSLVMYQWRFSTQNFSEKGPSL